MANFLDIAPVGDKLDKAAYNPTNIIEQGLMSTTSHAFDCFAQQKFSAELQSYLVNYVMSVMSYYNIYK